MEIQVIKRGRKLQIIGTVSVGQKTLKLDAHRLLQAGTKEGGEGSDAFMNALASGADVDDCFAAMEDRPDIDPKAELEQAIESGKEELLAHMRAVLNEIIHDGKNAQTALDTLAVGTVDTVEVPEGKGVCRVCQEVFDLHYIAGTSDLCMKHINPSFI